MTQFHLDATSIITFVSGGAGATVLSAAIRALAPPTVTSNAVYAWFYRFTNFILANFDKSTQAEGTMNRANAIKEAISIAQSPPPLPEITAAVDAHAAAMPAAGQAPAATPLIPPAKKADW